MQIGRNYYKFYNFIDYYKVFFNRFTLPIALDFIRY